MKEAAFLTEAGIPQTDAMWLAKELAIAEANSGKEKIALFDSFKGIVRNAGHTDHLGGHHGHSTSENPSKQ